MARIDTSIIHPLMQREREHFAAANPKSKRLSDAARAHLYGGVPMHWMSEWSSPFPLFVESAGGAHFTDVDGHTYADFCLGDTGAMFGHSPEPVAAAVRGQSRQGYTTMLPSEDAVHVGRLLAERFGLPYWQMTTTASDANRSVIKWARGVTGRKYMLVFDGCYHGMVDDTMVRSGSPGATAWRGLIGQDEGAMSATRVVEFNDRDALKNALESEDVAAVLFEPAMTNVGMVLPLPGYLEELWSLARAHGTLLIADETHTISTGPGGYCGAFDLKPDMYVLGKMVAGGIPCAVYGMSEAVALRMAELQRAKDEESGGEGHTGIGTTLSGNAFTMHLMRANLEQVMTEDAYARMIALAVTLAEGLAAIIEEHKMRWSITQLGARVELQYCEQPPCTGREAEAAYDPPLQRYMHLYLLNRGTMLTPFHNMMLICPQLEAGDVRHLLMNYESCIRELVESGRN